MWLPGFFLAHNFVTSLPWLQAQSYGYDTLSGMDCVLGMEFIIWNNVVIKGRNRLVRILSKSGIVWVAQEMLCVDGPTIHFMLGKT